MREGGAGQGQGAGIAPPCAQIMAGRAERSMKSVMLEVYGVQPTAERAPEFAGLTKRAKPAAAAALAEQNR